MDASLETLVIAGYVFACSLSIPRRGPAGKVTDQELIALAVALTTQCPYCLEIHKGAALKAGATEEEFAEVTLVAAALRAGAAITHGTHLIKG